jgi:hypothetical protein
MRCAGHEHRTLSDSVGGDCIGQPGDVAALVVFQVQVGRKIDLDHLSAPPGRRCGSSRTLVGAAASLV